MSPDEFIRAYERASCSHVVEDTLRLIDDNAVYWFSDGTSHVGKRAIEQAIRSNFETIQDEEFHILDVVWVAQSAETAACTFHFAWSGIIRGNEASGAGRGTMVLVRKGESWVVVHEHLSKEQ
jgi:ketosteroid isomerase-like protein